MALITPEFLQSKKYRAMRDRLALQHGGVIQPGVWDTTDLKVSQRAAGANGSVDVALGFGLVKATDPGNRGLYHVENDAVLNVTTGFIAGHATLPRLDQIALVVNDTTDGADASDIPSIAIYPGATPGGTTLDNRAGAATLPNSALLLADVLMPAAATTITTANIRDRRPWIRGANFVTERVASDLNVPTAFADISSAFTTRAEITTGAVEVSFLGNFLNTTAVAGPGQIRLQVDGVTVREQRVSLPATASYYAPAALTWRGTVTPGSRLFNLQYQSGAGMALQLLSSGTLSCGETIRELPSAAFVN